MPGAIILGVLAVTVAAVALGLEPWRGIAAPPPLEQPAAFACTNRICSQPVFDPAELGRTVTRNLAATGTKGYSLFR